MALEENVKINSSCYCQEDRKIQNMGKIKWNYVRCVYAHLLCVAMERGDMSQCLNKSIFHPV